MNLLILIGLLLILEVATINLSYGICKKRDDLILYIFLKKGIKFDPTVFDYINEDNEPEKNSNKFLGINPYFILFTPLLNVIVMLYINISRAHSLLHDENFKKYLVPMTEDEKREMNNLSKNAKKTYLGYLFSKAFISNIDNHMEKNKSILIENNPLPYLKYTYDEVMRLNNCTETKNYQFGILDERKVAVINLPELNYELQGINFEKESIDNCHILKKLTEEEIKEANFVVYLYGEDYNNNKQIQTELDKIISARNSNSLNIHSDNINYLKKEDKKVKSLKFGGYND